MSIISVAAARSRGEVRMTAAVQDSGEPHAMSAGFEC